MSNRFNRSHAWATNRTSSRAAFTLIEVLVVVAIMALLIAILLPSLARARAQAKTVLCEAQIMQLMRAALMYKTDFRGRLPGTGINDASLGAAEYAKFEAGTRTDWLTWSGTWTVSVPNTSLASTQFWKKVPRSGRLWRYYHDEKLLKCPSSESYNGKLSYSTPENVSMAMKGENGRGGLPPQMDRVSHPSFAIQFLDEDEQNGINDYSVDDGFGEPDMFGDRHLGRATVAFFDGHAEAQYFPRGPGARTSPNKPKVRYQENKSTNPFEAWMIQIAPFNCRYTPRPWKIRAWSQMPKYKCTANYPGGGNHSNGPGCEN